MIKRNAKDVVKIRGCACIASKNIVYIEVIKQGDKPKSLAI